MKKTFVALLFAIAASESQAACKSNAINGTWVTIQTSMVGENHTGFCNVKIAGSQLKGTCTMQTPSGLMPFDVSGPVTVAEKPVNNPGFTNNGLKLCSATVSMNFNAGQSTFQVALAKNGAGWTGTWSNNFGAEGVTIGMKQ